MAGETSSAGVLVRAFNASLRQEMEPFESVRVCFQMLTVLPASRRAVLDHLAGIFLNAREFTITKEKEKQLLDIVHELSLKDWSHILGDWCCHVLSRSRYETPNTTFVEKLLISAYKSGLDCSTQLDWLHPTLFNASFMSRNIFSDLLRRFVANFSQHFISGLVRYALTVCRQQQQVNIFPVGHTLDHLGHGFPAELQKTVDELLTSDQYSIQLLMDVSQSYPQICYVSQARLTRMLSLGAEMRDFVQLFTSKQQPNLLKRCLFARSSSWPQLFRTFISSYCSPNNNNNNNSSSAFARLFLEELVNLNSETLTNLLTSITEADIAFLLEKSIHFANSTDVDFKLLSLLTSAALTSCMSRPAEVFAEVLLEPKSIKGNNNGEIAAFYVILVSAGSRSSILYRSFAECLLERLTSHVGNRDLLMSGIWAVKELLTTEKQMEGQLGGANILLTKCIAERFSELLSLLASIGNQDFDLDLAQIELVLHEVVGFILLLVPYYTEPNFDKCPYSERAGLGIVLHTSNCMRMAAMNSDSLTTPLEKQRHRLLLEKLLFLLYIYVNQYLNRSAASSSLILLDAFVRSCFDSSNGNKVFSDVNKLNHAIFFQAVKILACCSAQPFNRPQQHLSTFEPGCLWRLALPMPDSNSLTFLAKVIVSLLSPDIIHVVASSGFDLPLDAAIENNTAVPIDYREYCLKIRTLVTVTCPFLLDFLSFFVGLSALPSAAAAAADKDLIAVTPSFPSVIILVPIFRALLYAALCCATASRPSVTQQNLAFTVRILSLLQQANLLQPPLNHLPSILPHMDPNQVATVLRCAWPSLISARSPHQHVSPSAIAPILTIIKSKLSQYGNVLPFFENDISQA